MDRIKRLTNHYLHPAKRLIIDFLIDNQPGENEVMAISRMLQKKLPKDGKYVSPGAQNGTNEFIRQLRKDGVIIRHERNGVCAYYYTNPDFLKLIEQLNEIIKDNPLAGDSWSDSIPAFHVKMQRKQGEQDGGGNINSGTPEHRSPEREHRAEQAMAGS